MEVMERQEREFIVCNNLCTNNETSLPAKLSVERAQLLQSLKAALLNSRENKDVVALC